MTGLFIAAGWQVILAQSNRAFQGCQAGDLVKLRCEHRLLVLGRATLLEIGSNTVTVCTASDRFTLDKADVVLQPLEPRLSEAQTPPVSPVSETSPNQTPSAPGISPSQISQILAVSGVGGLPVTAGPNIQSSTSGSLAQAAKQYSAGESVNSRQNQDAVRDSIIGSHSMEAYRESKLGPDGQYHMVVDPNSKAGPQHVANANKYYNDTLSGFNNCRTKAEADAQLAEVYQTAKQTIAKCDEYKKERGEDPQYETQIATLRNFVQRYEAGERMDWPPQPNGPIP